MSELNLEEIKKVAKALEGNNHNCRKCLLNDFDCAKAMAGWLITMADEIERLQKENVWSNAPIGANKANIHYLYGGIEFEVTQDFIRESVKTREREVAEKYAEQILKQGVPIKELGNYFEKMILEAKNDD